jgi:hypothetical protein
MGVLRSVFRWAALLGAVEFQVTANPSIIGMMAIKAQPIISLTIGALPLAEGSGGVRAAFRMPGALDLFERAALGFRDEIERENPGRHGEHAVEPERPARAEPID